ncbi:Taz1 interacting factor 1 [Schizosaccharomyces japonicus yFS275]|uniref:Autophagy-related protein 11 n=1 Tax=Schizosaccharomyces japonicus (strain yFS275 / FY16936) TaxID=402676 RepID=B6K701_SCHJY|nr:Taz1 interacting factor 1 [Schizosaccharomyces japonicus yFS275]EEB09305.1 Taz1 interacting factor 1 [Schizosaccharomyces japonicus yFS275]
MKFRLNDSYSGRYWTVKDVQWTPQDFVSWIMTLDIGLSDEAKLLMPNGMSLNETILNNDSDVTIYGLDQMLLNYIPPKDLPEIPNPENKVDELMQKLDGSAMSIESLDKVLSRRKMLAERVLASSKAHKEMLQTLKEHFRTSESSRDVAMNYLRRRQNGMKELLIVFYERLERSSVRELLNEFTMMPSYSLPLTPEKLLQPTWPKLDEWLYSISARYAEAQKRVQLCISAAQSISPLPPREVPELKEADEALVEIELLLKKMNNDIAHVSKSTAEENYTERVFRLISTHEREHDPALMNNLKQLRSSLASLQEAHATVLRASKPFWTSFYNVSLKYDALYEYLRQIAEEVDKSRVLASQCQNLYNLFADIIIEAVRRTEWQVSYDGLHPSNHRFSQNQVQEVAARKAWTSHFSTLLFDVKKLEHLPTVTRSNVADFLFRLQSEPKYQLVSQLLGTRLNALVHAPVKQMDPSSEGLLRENSALNERITVYKARCRNLEEILQQQARCLSTKSSGNQLSSLEKSKSQGTAPFFEESPSLIPISVIQQLSRGGSNPQESAQIQQLKSEISNLQTQLAQANLRIEEQNGELKSKNILIQELNKRNLLLSQDNQTTNSSLHSLKLEGVDSIDKPADLDFQNKSKATSSEQKRSHLLSLDSIYSAFEGKVGDLQQLLHQFQDEIKSEKHQKEIVELAKDVDEVQKLKGEIEHAQQNEAKAQNALSKKMEQSQVLSEKLSAFVSDFRRLDWVLHQRLSASAFESEELGHLQDFNTQYELTAEFNEAQRNTDLSHWMDKPNPELSFQEFVSRMESVNIKDLQEFALASILQVRVRELHWKKELQFSRDKVYKTILDSQEKVSLRNFKQGDLALFLPTRRVSSTRNVWVAFNVNSPHYYLRPRPEHKLESRDWLLARVVNVEENIADGSAQNHFKLPRGTTWHWVDATTERK